MITTGIAFCFLRSMFSFQRTIGVSCPHRFRRKVFIIPYPLSRCNPQFFPNARFVSDSNLLSSCMLRCRSRQELEYTTELPLIATVKIFHPHRRIESRPDIRPHLDPYRSGQDSMTLTNFFLLPTDGFVELRIAELRFLPIMLQFLTAPAFI